METGSYPLPWPPAPNSPVQAILRAQIMPAVAAAHISFQNLTPPRGPGLPPPSGVLASLPGMGMLPAGSVLCAARATHTLATAGRSGDWVVNPSKPPLARQLHGLGRAAGHPRV